MIAVWTSIVVAYFLFGLVVTWMANIGHRIKYYGTSLGWPTWVAGILAWPVVFLIGMRRR